MSLEYLIQSAYHAEVLPGARTPAIAGLPTWAKSERFDVDAKADDLRVPEAQLFDMLQTFLSERFQLTFHRVTEQVSGYRLTINASGHKLTRPRLDETTRFGGYGPRGQAIGRNAPFTDLLTFLTRQLNSPIDDATALTGNYDFDLTFDPASLGRAQRGTAAAADISRASIFTALQEQLGLRLDKARLPAVTYVIDGIQRPITN